MSPPLPIAPPPCPCGRGSLTVQRDYTGAPCGFSSRCKACSREAFAGLDTAPRAPTPPASPKKRRAPTMPRPSFEADAPRASWASRPVAEHAAGRRF